MSAVPAPVGALSTAKKLSARPVATVVNCDGFVSLSCRIVVTSRENGVTVALATFGALSVGDGGGCPYDW